jgi:hypothetical protein
MWHEEFIGEIIALTGTILRRPMEDLPRYERKRIVSHIDRCLSDLNKLRTELGGP